MPKFLDDIIVHGGAKAVINNATNASGAALHVGNVNAGNWNDGIVIDDPSGWAAVIYKRNNAAKMFTGLYNGTDNYIMMSSGYSNTGTAITAPRSDAVMRILPGSDTVEHYLPNYFGQKVGIGTTSPQGTAGIKLDVIGGIGAWVANNTSTLKLFSGRLVGAGRHIANLVSTSGNGSLELYRSDNLLNALITGSGSSYFNGGNVGIGTTSPVAALQVGSITATAMNQVIGKARIVGTDYVPSSTQMGTLDIASTTRSGSSPFNANKGPSLSFSQNISGYVDGYEVVLGAIKTISRQTGNTGQEAAMTFLVNGGTSTGVVERMRIEEDGNVGIGTATPGAKLQVGTRGTAGALTVPSTDGILFDFHNDGSPYARHSAIISQAGDASESVIDFWTKAASGTNSKKMTIRGDGNVGIGTASPNYKFVVSNGTQTGTFNPNSSGFMFLGSTSNHPLYFGVNDSTKMALLSNGNVGIGTTSPGYPFSLENSGTGLISRIYNTNTNGQGLLIRAGATSSATRAFQVASSNDTKIMTVNSNGKVGIGTNSPSGEFHVSGTADFYTDLNGNDSAVVFEEAGNNSWRIGNKSSDDTFRISQSASSLATNTRLTIANGGNATFAGTIGSGAITSTGKITGTELEGTSLDINGAADISGNLSGVDTYTGQNIALTIGASGSGRRDPFTALHASNNTITISQFGQSHAASPAANQIGVSNAEQHLHLITDSSANMQAGTSTKGIFLRSGGNVGIGTKSPGAKLEVAGDILLGANHIGRDAHNVIDFDIDNQITFKTDQSTALQIDSNQSVKVIAGSLQISGDNANFVTLTETGAGKMTIAAADDIVLDAGSDIILDAAGDDIRFKVSGTEFGKFNNASSNMNIYSSIQDKDIKFWGMDGNTTLFTALTLDMSDAGAAIFAGDVSIPVAKRLYFGGGSHTYISEDVDDRLRFFCGGDEHIRFTDGGNGDRTDFYRPTYFALAATFAGSIATPSLTLGANSTISASQTTDDSLYLNSAGTGVVRVNYTGGLGGFEVYSNNNQTMQFTANSGGITIPGYINHAGDSGTKFGFEGNDAFRLYTASTMRLQIDSAGAATFAGNVSINKDSIDGLKISRTSGASENIHIGVQAGTNLTSTTYPGIIKFHGTNQGEIYTQGTQPLVLGTNATARLTIAGGGGATFTSTIGSGAITSTGKITGTELEGTSLDINGNADISGNLAVDGIANLDNTDIDGTFNATGTTFDVNSSASLTLDNTNTTNGVKINTATSGSPVTIGHTTSEVVIADNLTVNGDLTTKGATILESTTNTTIKDRVVQINDGVTGDNTNDAGLMINRGDLDNVFFGWDESADKFVLISTTTGAAADVAALGGTDVESNYQTLVANIIAPSMKIGFGNSVGDVHSTSTSTSLGTSNTVVPSQNAVKSYVDAKTWNWNDITAGTVPSTILNSNVTSVSGNAGTVTNGVYTTGDQSIAGKKSFAGPINIEQTWFYDKSAGSLDTTGYACAGLSSGSNGNSATFIFDCGGGAGSTYQKIVYNCWNVSGTWNTSKDIDEGANDFDVTVSSNASTITFTFKTRSGSQNYTPRVHVQAMGHSIVTTY